MRRETGLLTSPASFKGEHRPEAMSAIRISEKYLPQTLWFITLLRRAQIISAMYV